IDDFNFSRRFATLAQLRILRKSLLVEPSSNAEVPQDPNDSPILQAAITCGADKLIDNKTACEDSPACLLGCIEHPHGRLPEKRISHQHVGVEEDLRLPYRRRSMA